MEKEYRVTFGVNHPFAKYYLPIFASSKDEVMGMMKEKLGNKYSNVYEVSEFEQGSYLRLLARIDTPAYYKSSYMKPSKEGVPC